MRGIGSSGLVLALMTVVLPVAFVPPVFGCVGDCDQDGIVSVDELVRGIRIALGSLPLEVCEPIDANRDDLAAVDELVGGVDKSMNGCLDGPAAEILFAPHSNQLDVFDLERGFRDVLIPIERFTINGQVCALPDATGNFVAGDDTGQPEIRPGWGIFSPDGRRLAKLPLPDRPDEKEVADPIGCAFAPDGRLFTTAIGTEGGADGQLIVYFPPAYEEACILDQTVATPGSMVIDEAGDLYVAETARGIVSRFASPFPATPAECAGYQTSKSTFITFAPTPVIPLGVGRGPNGHWFVASVFGTQTVTEHDADGTFLRNLFEPGTAGSPSGVAVDSEGTVYYSDLGLGEGFPPSPVPGGGSVRRITFDAAGEPHRPEVLLSGISFPDAVAVLARPPESTMYGRTLRRLFYNPDEKVINRNTAADLIPKWRYTTGAIVTGSPAVAWVRLPEEGLTRVVYATSWDGNVYALRLRNGSRVWQFTAKPHPGATYPFVSSPAVEWLGNRRVVYVAGGMTMYCLDAATGEEIWQFDAGTGCTTCNPLMERNQIESSPAVFNGLVYFGMDINDREPGKGGLYGVRADDGRLAWYFDLETGETCRPLPGDDIRRFDGFHTAEQLGLPEDFFATRPGCDFDRTETACGNVWSSASIDAERGLLYVASSNCDTDDDPKSIPPRPPMPAYDRALIAVRLDGTPEWVWRPDEVDNDDLSFGGVPNLFSIDFEGERRDVVGVGNKNGTYYVLDRDGVNEVNGVTADDDPEIRNPELPYWQTKVVPGGSIGGIISSAAVNEDEGKVYFGTAIGLDIGRFQRPAAHALNLDDGSVAWQNEDVLPSYSPTAVVPGLAFIGTIASAVINVFDTDDGTVLASLVTRGQLGGAASLPAFVGGMLVTGGGVGELGARPDSQDCDANPTTPFCQAILDKPVSLFCVRGTLGCVEQETCEDGNICTYDYRGEDGECLSEAAPNTLECTTGETKGLCADGECMATAP